MGQTIWPIPAATAPDNVTAPVGFRKAVFEGQFTGAGPHIKSGSYPSGIYRLETAAATNSPFIFNNGLTSTVGAANSPLTFALASTSSQMSISKPADGGSWTSASLPSDQYWTAIGYGAGTYVAFSSWGAVATSPDGVTWTTRGSINAMYSVAYGNGIFVAVGNGQTVYTSTDGITWTARNSGWNVNYRDIAFGDGVFVGIFPNNSNVNRSVDGINWTVVSNPAGALDWRAIAYGAGRFVMIAYGSTTIAHSTNGSTWTSTGSAMPNSSAWYSMAFGNGVFVALATNNSTNAVSTNGTTWTAMTLPNTGSNNFLNITYSAGFFVAVQEFTAIAFTSTNGTTWTQRALPSSSNWTAVAGSGSGFAAVSFDYGRAVARSSGSSDTGRIAFSVFPASATTY